MNTCYGISSPSYTTVKKWYAQFKRGRKSTDDAEHSGCLNEAVTEENIKNMHRIILDDQKIKVR